MVLAAVKDLGRDEFFTRMTEVNGTVNDAKHSLEHLDEYMAD